MKNRYAPFLLILLLSVVSMGQNGNGQAPAVPPESKAVQPTVSQPPADTSNFTSAKGFVLEEATPVRLRFNRTVSSADAHWAIP